MLEFRVREKDTLVGVWLNGNKGNVVLASGIPQSLDKYHPFVQQMGRMGYNLFVPRYNGTFESKGKFSVKNSVESIQGTIDLVKRGKATELFNNSEIKWENNEVYIIGFSYGALPSLLQNRLVKKTILICPFIDIKYHLGNFNGENLEKTFYFIEQAYTNLYRFRAKEIIEDLSKVTLPQKKDIYLVTSKRDDSIPIEEINFILQRYNVLKHIIKETGHSISIEDSILKSILEEI